MIRLVVMACLQASPSGTAPIECREIVTAVHDVGAVTPFGCVSKAQEQLAQMRASFAGLTPTRWRCEA
jgi:hypothetical protein